MIMLTTPTLSAPDFGKFNLSSTLSQLAQLAKSMLAGGRDWGQLQDASSTKLMHVMLDAQPSPAAAQSLQNLFGLGVGLSTDLAAQQKSAMQSLLLRYNTLIEDLRKSQNQQDVSLVLAGYMSDLDGMVRDNGGKVMTLLNSASAASTVLTERTLDDLIAAGPQKALPSPA
jgi:hypothetical protein